jgi:hypothetical protein
MGDRVLMQVVKGDEFGPVVYCHWAGESTPEIVRRLAVRMADRPGDLEYSSARLVQEAINGADRSTSFGIWNAEKKLTAADSHGDAGVVLIDCANGHKCECFGGYLKTDADGFPAVKQPA